MLFRLLLPDEAKEAREDALEQAINQAQKNFEAKRKSALTAQF